MLAEEQIVGLAQSIYNAEISKVWVEPVSELYPEATVEDAYRIGMAVRDLKKAAGVAVKGHKVGLTSKAMREINNATEPDYGFLYEDWFVPEGSVVDFDALNKPRVEVEIGFVMKEPLTGRFVNAADVIRATDFVLPLMEVIYGRYTHRGPKPLVDTIADGAWCGFVVLGGKPAKLTDIDIRSIGASLAINGEIEQTGSARAVMANPINAVAWLATKLNEFGVSIEAGDVILSGSFIRAAPFKRGDTLTALFDQLGEVTLSSR